MPQRGEQDEAIGAVCACVSADFLLMCSWLCVYACVVNVFVYVLTGNTCSASLLTGTAAALRL